MASLNDELMNRIDAAILEAMEVSCVIGDYAQVKCAYCNEDSANFSGRVIHAADCEGVALLAKLEECR